MEYFFLVLLLLLFFLFELFFEPYLDLVRIKLVESLNHESHRTEAAMLLRKFVDKIVLKPDPQGDGLPIDLHGDLTGILNFAAMDGKSLDLDDLSFSQEKMVAGARNPRQLTLACPV